MFCNNVIVETSTDVKASVLVVGDSFVGIVMGGASVVGANVVLFGAGIILVVTERIVTTPLLSLMPSDV